MESQEIFNVYSDEKQYLNYWMNLNGVFFRGTELVHPEGFSLSFTKKQCYSDYRRDVGVWNQEQKQYIPNLRKSVKLFSEFDLEREFSILMDKQIVLAKNLLKSRLKYVEESGEVAKFLGLFIDLTPEDLLCFKHWMWNVKRSIFGLKRKNHLMVNFLGGQNSGKTYNLSQMLEITLGLNFFFVEKDLKNLFDERRGKIFNNKFVCFLDEMGGSGSFEQKNMIRELKQKITEENFEFRPMRSNDYETLKQNCSFLSATNESLQEILNDFTGMRRFWEFKVSKIVRQKEMDTIDFTKLWTEIDENLDSGYLDLLREDQVIKNIVNIQQETVNIDIIKEFLDENDIQKPMDNPYFIKGSTLYKMFRFKCKEDGIRYIDSHQSFTVKLKRYGILTKQKWIGDKNTKVYLVDKHNIDESKWDLVVI